MRNGSFFLEYANLHFAIVDLSTEPQSTSTFGDAETRGCAFPWCSRRKKKKELDFSNSLIFKAIQDGLEPTNP